MKKRKFPLLGKIILLVLVAYAAFTLIRQHKQITQLRSEAETLTAQIAETQQKVQRLQSDIDSLHTDEGIEKVARDQLGLVGAGEIVIQDVGN